MIEAAGVVLQKTPAADLQENIQGIQKLLGKDKESATNVARRHVIPFETLELKDQDDERPFLLCEYNRFEISYRSPWTNKKYSKTGMKTANKDIPEGEEDVRALEGAANEVWDAYTQMYYGREAVGSVYLRQRPDLDPSSTGFEGIFGIHKKEDTGSWDSVHFIKVDEPNDDKFCSYHVESFVVVSLVPAPNASSVSCSMNKDTSKSVKVRMTSLLGSHLENIGKMLEDIEIDFRSRMERVEVPKCLEVMESIYRKQSKGSRTAHLISGGEPSQGAKAAGAGGGFVPPTGMGVGAGMIGEIANRAKAKQQAGGPNPFMEAMNANMLKKKKDDTDSSGAQYTDLKAGLKKRETKPATSAAAGDAPAPEFADFRNKLKKTNK